MVPILGLAAFLINLCCCVIEEPLDEIEFDYDWHEPTKAQLGEDAYDEVEQEMQKLNNPEGKSLEPTDNA